MEDEERASTKHSSAKKKGKRRRSSSEVSLPEAKSRKRDVIDFSDKAIAEVSSIHTWIDSLLTVFIV